MMTQRRVDSDPITEAAKMKVQYLIVDSRNQLRLIQREHVEAIWRGRASAADFGCGDLTELRLVSVVCGAMIYGLGWTNWLRLGVWLVIGLVFNFSYGRSHSRLET